MRADPQELADYIVQLWRASRSCPCHTDDQRLAMLIVTALTKRERDLRTALDALAAEYGIELESDVTKLEALETGLARLAGLKEDT
jgi:predicted mannosyl-3-phosphoglycerate phosphatase (HAD superfamily)